MHNVFLFLLLFLLLPCRVYRSVFTHGRSFFSNASHSFSFPFFSFPSPFFPSPFSPFSSFFFFFQYLFFFPSLLSPLFIYSRYHVFSRTPFLPGEGPFGKTSPKRQNLLSGSPSGPLMAHPFFPLFMVGRCALPRSLDSDFGGIFLRSSFVFQQDRLLFSLFFHFLPTSSIPFMLFFLFPFFPLLSPTHCFLLWLPQ